MKKKLKQNLNSMEFKYRRKFFFRLPVFFKWQQINNDHAETRAIKYNTFIKHMIPRAHNLQMKLS